jgi:AcrR family transcriptional regulator
MTSDFSTLDDGVRERIVDAALDLAEMHGWDAVRLHDVAERLGIGLDAVATRFRDRDAIADAWFARARDAMLEPTAEGFAAEPPHHRLYLLLCRWLDVLAPHRRVSVEMLKVKLWPFHPHHWMPLPFELSRIVLWWRDAAGLDSPPPRREVEEIALTWLFLGTLAIWSCDDSDGQTRTRRFLARRLADADCLLTAGRRLRVPGAATTETDRLA